MKKIFLIITTILICSFILLPKNTVEAETIQQMTERLQKEVEQKAKELDEIKRQQAEVQDKIKKEEATQQNLSKSINYISYQIQSTELTIQEKQGQIEKNEVEIQVLGTEIENRQNQILSLADSIEYLEEIVSTRNRENYMNSKVSWFEFLISSQSLTKAIKQLEYFGELKKHDIQLLEDMEGNKTELSDEKKQLAEQKTEVERLKAEIEFEKGELEKAKEDLAWQKSQKNQMLADSNARKQDQQALYDNLSEEYKKSLEELNAIQSQLAQATVSGTDVKEGWIIGKQGATGNVWTYKENIGWVEGDGICEGYHVHFAVFEKNPSTGYWYDVNPAKYILAGKLRRPFNSYEISQYYGATSFNSNHTGIDYVGPGCGAPVYAAGDGIIQYGYETDYGYGYDHAGPNDPKGAYFAWIYHGTIDGVEVKTGYWHLQYP